jgi:LPS-assembly protein
MSSYAAENVTIEADNVDSSDQNFYHATGNVKVFQGERTLTADEVTYFKDRGYLEASGAVRMSEVDQTVDCERMEYDTESETGIFYDADAFMQPYNWFTAREVHKTGKNSYSLYGTTFTTCSGEDPAWSLSATSAKIDVGGYFSAFNVAGWAKSVPVFYSPYIIYPIKSERETGFLVPKLGYSSSMGAFVQPKFFYNIDVDKDTTVAALFSQNESTLYANEFRMTPSSKSSIYNYFEFARKDRKSPAEEAHLTGPETASGRFFVYNKSNIAITDRLTLKLDIEAVSDYSYQDDYEEYTLMSDYDNDDETYYNSLQLLYAGQYSDVTLKYNDVMSYTITSAYMKEHTYLRPSISAEKDISFAPVNVRYYVSHDEVRNTKFIYNYSNDTKENRKLDYTRDHASLMFYKPISVYVGTFTPSLKGYYTRWYDYKSNYDILMPQTDKSSGNAYLEVKDDSITRQLYTIDYSFAFSEIYKNYKNFRHSIYNTLRYTQTPDINQTNLFDYIDQDIIDETKNYSYSLKNYFKSPEWMLKIENVQGYEMTRSDRRYEPLASKVEFSTVGGFYSYLEHEYNYYDRDTDFFLTRLSIGMNKFIVSGKFAFDKETSDDKNTTIQGTITYTTPKYDLSYTRTSSGWNNKLSWKAESSVDDAVQLLYKSECWEAGVSYKRKTEIKDVAVSNESGVEHVVMLTLGLRGLGKYTSSVYTATTTENGDSNEQ